jgi:CheY-like chemotaxis protein
MKRTMVMDVSAQTARILVIDDEEHLRNLLADILKTGGYQVKTAPHGKEGLTSFQEEQYDVVITDLGMPEMSGLEVAEEIKRIDPSTPVVLLTGLNVQLGDEIIKDKKVDLVISKPFQLAEVLETVQNALNIKKNSKLRV